MSEGTPGKKWKKPLSHAQEIVQGGTECLHPMCGACRDELMISAARDIARELEQIHQCLEVLVRKGN